MATAGEEWIAPEVRAARDEEQFILESEEIFAKELRERCVNKGLDYETELAAHQKAVAEKHEKMLAKKGRR